MMKMRSWLGYLICSAYIVRKRLVDDSCSSFKTGRVKKYIRDSTGTASSSSSSFYLPPTLSVVRECVGQAVLKPVSIKIAVTSRTELTATWSSTTIWTIKIRKKDANFKEWNYFSNVKVNTTTLCSKSFRQEKEINIVEQQKRDHSKVDVLWSILVWKDTGFDIGKGRHPSDKDGRSYNFMTCPIFFW